LEVQIAQAQKIKSQISFHKLLWEHFGRIKTKQGGVVPLHYKFKHPHKLGMATNWSKISSGTDHNLAIKPMVAVMGLVSNGSGNN
jgi:hypothetical protein